MLPVFLLWDALAMMLIGMALFRLDVLQGGRSPQFYRRLALVGLIVGFGVNAVEVQAALAADFDLLSVFANMRPTYHVGRLAVALGYVGIVVLVVQAGRLHALTARLSAVGRMALTNYLMHSVICLFVFTGAGLALVGELSRASVYLVVLAIWAAAARAQSVVARALPLRTVGVAVAVADLRGPPAAGPLGPSGR